MNARSDASASNLATFAHGAKPSAFRAPVLRAFGAMNAGHLRIELPDGSGRFSVRCIRPSSSRSRYMLSDADAAAISNVPTVVPTTLPSGGWAFGVQPR